MGLVFWFVFIAAVLLALFLLLSRRLGRLALNLLGFCVSWAILSVILPNIFFFHAASELPAGLIAVSIALVPILTLCGALVLGREAPTLRRAAGICLGAAGAMLILLPRTSLPDTGDAFFVLLTFAGAACYAAEHLFIETRIPKHVPIDVLLFVMFSIATLILFPVTIMTGSFYMPAWPPAATEAAILAASMVTLVDYFLITLLIIWAGPVFTSQAAYIVTLAGVTWGIALFNESHSLWIYLAIGFLLAGISLVRPLNDGSRSIDG